MNLDIISQEPPSSADSIYTDVCIVGSHHREDQCTKFLQALDDMKFGKDFLGALLVPHPTNEYDPNAIMVQGIITRKKLLSSSSDTFDLGWLPKKMAFAISKQYDSLSVLFPKLLEFNYNSGREYPISIIIDIYEE